MTDLISAKDYFYIADLDTIFRAYCPFVNIMDVIFYINAACIFESFILYGFNAFRYSKFL